MITTERTYPWSLWMCSLCGNHCYNDHGYVLSVVIINLLCYNAHGYVLSVVIINLLCYNDHIITMITTERTHPWSL
jgi:hypothetical protein